MGYNPAVDRVMDAAMADLTRQGAVVIDPTDIPTLGQFDDDELNVLLYEFKADLNKYLDWIGPKAPVHSLKDIIDFNERHKDQEMPYFGQELMIRAQEKGPLTDPKYLTALEKDHRLSRKEGIDAVMTKFTLDALVAPTGAPPWLIDLINGDYATDGSSTIAAVAGYPHITVPMGDVFGLPVGLSFIGRAWSEPTLIKLAYAYEQATKHRQPPEFKPTATLKR
jgi:amidase